MKLLKFLKLLNLKINTHFLILVWALLSLSLSHPATALPELPPLPNIIPTIPAAPSLAAKSYVLLDYFSDTVIAEHDIDQRVEPASLTKMMTVYIVDHALKSKKINLSDTVKVSEHAWRSSGSRMFLELNSQPTVEELLKGIIIQSGNDASIAIAEHIAGSEPTFAELMNLYAKELGMNNTHFMNATGLPDPNHYTTAKDMGILARALIRDFPDSYKIYSQKEFIYHNIKQTNRNRLLWINEAVDGIKTGHTESAGYCLVASGQKEGMRLIAVIMGANSDKTRTDETNKLLTYGFRFYETRRLYPAGMNIKQGRVWMGKEKEVGLGFAQDVYVTFGKGQYERLKGNININPEIKAPIKEGDKLGTFSVTLEDKTLVEQPVIALTNVDEAGIFSRLWDSISLMFHSLWNKVF